MTFTKSKQEQLATASPSGITLSPLTPKEIADRIVPSDPRIAPDGSHVVFVASPGSKTGEKWTRSLWIVGEGLPARQFTSGVADDIDPRWSPDGSRILFRSDRLKPGSDDYRLFLLSVSGGEAVPLGELGGELSEPDWSPDGRWVAALRKDPEDRKSTR